MIHVIASIRVKSGKVPEFLEAFKVNASHVKNEKGCIDYSPTLDFKTGLPPQVLDENVVTIIEKWSNMEALKAHMTMPHMLAYKEKVKDIVLDISLKVLEEA